MRITVLVIALAATACASRPQYPTTTRNAALERYSKGESLDEIACELGLPDRDAAREAVHDGVRATLVRYYREQ